MDVRVVNTMMVWVCGAHNDQLSLGARISPYKGEILYLLKTNRKESTQEKL